VGSDRDPGNTRRPDPFPAMCGLFYRQHRQTSDAVDPAFSMIPQKFPRKDILKKLFSNFSIILF